MKLFSWYSRIPLVWRNLGAFVLGCLAGLLIYKGGLVWGDIFLSRTLAILSPFGTVLVNMLKMIVIPIIFFSIVSFFIKNYSSISSTSASSSTGSAMEAGLISIL